MSVRKIIGIIILALAFAIPQSGAYADTQTAKLIKKIAEKDPLFMGFSHNFNHVCAAEKQAILEFGDSGESVVLENYSRQATMCLEKLEKEFFGNGFEDSDSGNWKLRKYYRQYYCQENKASFVMAVDNDFQSQLKMRYDENCRAAINFDDSLEICGIRLRNHFNSIAPVKTVLGGLELVEIPESARRLYSGGSPERLQRIHNEQKYEVVSQCVKISERSRYGIKILARFFEFRKENGDAYHGYVQKYLNANCDAGKTCRKDPEMAINLWRDNLHFYGPIRQKDLEIFAINAQSLRGNDKVIPAALAAIEELKANRKADIDRICAEYTFENSEAFCNIYAHKNNPSYFLIR